VPDSGIPKIQDIKQSKYLMILNRCDTNNLSINQFQYFNENLIIHSILYIV